MNNSEQIPYLRTYQEALEHHDSVKPFKSGEFKGLRPLGKNRRYTRARIAVDAETKDVECTLYGHRVVVFKPNDEIHVSMCGWNTPSTREFAWSVCRAYMWNINGGLYIKHHSQTSPVESDSHTMILKQGEILNAVSDRTYMLNRKAFNEVKKRYAKLREYFVLMSKVVEEISVVDINDTVNKGLAQNMNYFANLRSTKNAYYTKMLKGFMVTMKPRIDAMVESENLDEYYECFKSIAALALPFNYRKEVFVNLGGERAEDILKTFDEYLKIVHAKEVFDCKELPSGVINGNKNKQYIKSHNVYFN
jgi:hypothetical protein